MDIAVGLGTSFKVTMTGHRLRFYDLDNAFYGSDLITRCAGSL